MGFPLSTINNLYTPSFLSNEIENGIRWPLRFHLLSLRISCPLDSFRTSVYKRCWSQPPRSFQEFTKVSQVEFMFTTLLTPLIVNEYLIVSPSKEVYPIQPLLRLVSEPSCLSLGKSPDQSPATRETTGFLQECSSRTYVRYILGCFSLRRVSHSYLTFWKSPQGNPGRRSRGPGWLERIRNKKRDPLEKGKESSLSTSTLLYRKKIPQKRVYETGMTLRRKKKKKKKNGNYRILILWVLGLSIYVYKKSLVYIKCLSF